MNPATFIGWMWPVPIRDGRKPVISHEFEAGARYLPSGALNYATHLGLDIMYQRIASDPTGPPNYVAIPKHGSNPGWITYPHTTVRSAGPGKIWDAKVTKLGHSIQIDHGHVDGVGLITFYQHLTEFAQPWKKGDPVLPGTALGTMGGDPMNSPHLTHLHFEVWLPDGKARAGDWPVDPAPFLTMWSQV